MSIIKWFIKQYHKLDTSPGLIKRGRWRVRYPEGYCSVWFTYDCTVDYSKMFGGEIEYKGDFNQVPVEHTTAGEAG